MAAIEAVDFSDFLFEPYDAHMIHCLPTPFAKQDCAILAAVHQRGDPFVDSMTMSLQDVKSLWEVT